MPQALRALQGQEAPQGLKEKEVPPVSVEPLEVPEEQVSDGSRPSALLHPSEATDASSSTITPSGQSCSTGQWGVWMQGGCIAGLEGLSVTGEKAV